MACTAAGSRGKAVFYCCFLYSLVKKIVGNVLVSYYFLSINYRSTACLHFESNGFGGEMYFPETKLGYDENTHKLVILLPIFQAMHRIIGFLMPVIEFLSRADDYAGY